MLIIKHLISFICGPLHIFQGGKEKFQWTRSKSADVCNRELSASFVRFWLDKKKWHRHLPSATRKIDRREIYGLLMSQNVLYLVDVNRSRQIHNLFFVKCLVTFSVGHSGIIWQIKHLTNKMAGLLKISNGWKWGFSCNVALL